MLQPVSALSEPSEQQGQTPTRPKPSIEGLSDLVFGLALSVGAISLVSSPPVTSAQIYNDLATYGFSFAILITIWLRYTRIMSVLPLASSRVINLNIILLFAVSVEPFLFNIVRNPPSVTNAGYVDTASTLYALDMGIALVILGVFTFSLADEEKRLIPKDLIKQFRAEGLGWFATGGLFLVSALPEFYTVKVGSGNTPLRYDFWLVPILLVYVLKWVQRVSKRAHHAVDARNGGIEEKNG